MSSTFHLGHPERAWRAFSQWRTSWLSREGVVAVITYVPAIALAATWMWPDRAGALSGLFGWASAIMAIVTVYCTAMIYRSLKTIPEWANAWTVVNYLTISIASGAVWLVALLSVFGAALETLNMASAGILILAWGFKLAYWRHIDTAKRTSTPETATGLGRLGRVTHLEAPHTEQNYLLQEMGYQVARRHAAKLRIYAQVLGFLVPAGLIGAAINLGTANAAIATIGAAISLILGLLIERWLVFAQARHVVTLYYGRLAT
jgi:DMSO reductase anchor subunit